MLVIQIPNVHVKKSPSTAVVFDILFPDNGQQPLQSPSEQKMAEHQLHQKGQVRQSDRCSGSRQRQFF